MKDKIKDELRKIRLELELNKNNFEKRQMLEKQANELQKEYKKAVLDEMKKSR